MVQKSDKYIAELIENGISSSFWKEYFVPELKEEIEKYKNMLVSCPIDDVRALQEHVRCCEEWLKRPAADLKKSKGG